MNVGDKMKEQFRQVRTILRAIKEEVELLHFSI